MIKSTSTQRAFIVLSMVFFIVILLFSWDVNGLKTDVKNFRKSDRAFTCATTYEGIRRISISSFFPEAPRTPEEQKKVNKFNFKIHQLKKECLVQVTTTH